MKSKVRRFLGFYEAVEEAIDELLTQPYGGPLGLLPEDVDKYLEKSTHELGTYDLEIP